MATPFVGEIRIFAGNFAPTGWALCNGQILPISQNTALFSLLGVAYGGNGTSTFALPDLRGRVPIQPGQGPGLTDRSRGEFGGTEAHILDASQIPSHTHTFRASTSNGVSDNPTNLLPAHMPAAIAQYVPTADTNLSPGAAGSSGGNHPHNNMQPFLVMNYIIALQGIFPSMP